MGHAVLVVHVRHVVVADRAKALRLVRRLRAARGEHRRAAEALAERLRRGARSVGGAVRMKGGAQGRPVSMGGPGDRKWQARCDASIATDGWEPSITTDGWDGDQS